MIFGCLFPPEVLFRVKNMIIVPQCKDIITKSENDILKEALFVFVATTDRKI